MWKWFCHWFHHKKKKKPKKPKHLTAKENLMAHGIQLAWQESTPGCTFNVYKGDSAGNETSYQTGVADTQFLDATGTGGTTYFYKVTAVLNGIESDFSNEASAVFPTLPDAPTSLTATAV